MKDIPYCTEYFNFILYGDNTTLSSTIQISLLSPRDLNAELAKVFDWLAVNKLSLNVRKTKYVIFHAINKKIQGVVPNLEINGIPLERVQNFNFLGLLLNENMSRKPHIDLLSNKLAKCAGVLNKLKHFLPMHILRTLYFSMVQSRMTYGISNWGFDCYRIEKLQTRQNSTQSIGNMPPLLPRHLLPHILQIMHRNPKYDRFQSCTIMKKIHRAPSKCLETQI